VSRLSKGGGGGSLLLESPRHQSGKVAKGGLGRKPIAGMGVPDGKAGGLLSGVFFRGKGVRSPPKAYEAKKWGNGRGLGEC